MGKRCALRCVRYRTDEGEFPRGRQRAWRLARGVGARHAPPMRFPLLLRAAAALVAAACSPPTPAPQSPAPQSSTPGREAAAPAAAPQPGSTPPAEPAAFDEFDRQMLFKQLTDLSFHSQL